MDEVKISEAILESHPSWKASVSKSGAAVWVEIIRNDNRSFSVQLTPSEGVGVSERIVGEIDFGGHEEVFDDLKSALDFVQSR